MSQRETLSTIIKAQFDQQVHFLQQLVRARSANPFTPETARPDAPVEEEIAAVICRELDRFGLEAAVYGISSQRPNVVCTLRGSGPQHKTLILTTHMDTIEPTGYIRDPWGAEIEAGRLYGVGVADAKAQIAAFMYAAHALRLIPMSVLGGRLGCHSFFHFSIITHEAWEAKGLIEEV